MHKDPKATVAFICGIASFVFPPAAIAGIILGIIARKNPCANRRLASWGLWLSVASLAIYALALIILPILLSILIGGIIDASCGCAEEITNIFAGISCGCVESIIGGLTDLSCGCIDSLSSMSCNCAEELTSGLVDAFCNIC